MSSLEDYNIANDPRSGPAAEAPALYLDNGEELSLPMTWEVCGVCNGKGKHVNPAIDAGGLTHDDMHDDPDFADAYMAGVFDQTCNRCKGRTTVPVVNYDALTPEQREQYEAQQRADWEEQEERLAEIRAGC